MVRARTAPRASACTASMRGTAGSPAGATGMTRRGWLRRCRRPPPAQQRQPPRRPALPPATGAAAAGSDRGWLRSSPCPLSFVRDLPAAARVAVTAVAGGGDGQVYWTAGDSTVTGPVTLLSPGG